MADINVSDELVAGLEAYLFKCMDQALETAPHIAMFNQVFDVFTVDDDNPNFGWYGTIPRMRKWEGDREYVGFNKYDYNVLADPFELSMAPTRRELENRDKYGEVKRKLQMMADEAVRHLLRTGADLIEAGETDLCYDGQFMYDTDHVDPGAKYTTAQSNKGTTALSDVTYAAARLAMLEFKDDNGNPVGVNPDLLIVPPALESTAKLILENEWNVDSMDRNFNVNRGTAKLWVNPFLTDINNWYLVATGAATSAYFIAKLQEYLFTSVMDERARHENRYLMGIDTEFADGYGNWRYTYGAIVA